MEWTLTAIMYLLLAAAIATFGRFYDSPVTPISQAKLVAVMEVFIGALIAAFVAAMALSVNPSLDITAWNNYAVIIGAAAGGMVYVKALVGGATSVAAPPKA